MLTNLKALAEHLGVSQATVSRALNNYSSVNAETKARVQAAALELGYRPNSSARRLATGRIGALGIVMPAGTNLLTDPHFVDFLAGLTETLAKHENEVVLTASSDIATYRRFAATGKVDAFVLSAPVAFDERIALLDQIKFPFVVHGRCETEIPYAYYDIENKEGFRDATTYLRELGHRDIGLLNGPSNAMFAVQREEGYREAFQGFRVREELILSGPMTEEAGYRNAGLLLDLPEPPTALLCSSTLMAMGVNRQVRGRGFTVGKDISIITHDDGLSSLKTENFSVPLTVTKAPIRQAGEELAEMARTLIDGESIANLQKVAQVELIIRGSTGPMLS